LKKQAKPPGFQTAFAGAKAWFPPKAGFGAENADSPESLDEGTIGE